MKDNLKFLLIAGGVGYFLFKDQLTALFNTTTRQENFNGANPTPDINTTTGQQTEPPPAPPAGIWTQLSNWAKTQPAFQATGTLNFWEWSFGYAQFRGVNVPAPEEFGIEGPRKITLDEFRAIVSTAGMNGLAKGAARFTRQAWGY